MHGGRRDVESIGVGRLWEETFLDDCYSQLLRQSGHLQERNPLQEREPALGHLRIPQAGLIDDEKRRHKIKTAPSALPPVERDLLVGG